MTHTERKSKVFTDIALPVFLFFVLILLRFAAEIKNSIILGIKLSVSSVLPALFPFFILSDYLVASLKVNEKSPLARGFERLFGISSAAFPAFLCGVVCGFPLGVKCAAEYYERGAISREECERLIGFTNNPSLAFVISAVGLGMRGSLKDGVLLYIAVTVSAVAVGILFRKKRENSLYAQEKPRQNFNLTVSVKNAGYSSLAISSYIIFFSAVLGALGAIIKCDIFNMLTAALLEVGNAASIIASDEALSPALSMAATGFALGFSGFSVHLQGFAFLPAEISRKKYIFMKLLQGVICAVLAFALSRF